MPGFFDKRMRPISKVEAFSFTNQDGQPFTQEALKNKVAIVNFFFTTCTTVCPRMNNNLKPAYEALKAEPNVLFLSFTSDPSKDSAAVLKRYAESMQLDTKKWIFLTGRKDSLYNTARTSYLLDDPKNNAQNIDEQFLHTQFFALVDKQGKVRKIYDGLKKEELDLLKEDIGRLLKD